MSSRQCQAGIAHSNSGNAAISSMLNQKIVKWQGVYIYFCEANLYF